MTKVAFMSSDPIAVVSLESLLHSDDFELVGVVSNPDKPKGRGKKLSPNGVSEWALRNGVELFRPDKGPDKTTLDALRTLGTDIIVVMAYGRILKKDVLEFSSRPCINLHASILPELRGASPIESAIALGFKKTGVSLMRIEPAMDSGPVCDVSEVEISDVETSASLRAKIGAAAAELLMRNLSVVVSGNADFIPQDASKATYVRKLDKSDAFLDFRKSATELECRIRAFGGGIFEYEGEQIKIGSAHVERADENFSECGFIECASARDGFKIACSRGILCVETLQRPCAKTTTTEDFFNSRSICAHCVLKSFDNKDLLRKAFV